MKINVHAGHNPDGKVACGAVGLIRESTQARIITSKLILLLEKRGHTVYNCTVDDGSSQSNVLSKIIQKCNSHNVDLDISIHFNAGANAYTQNKITTGTECYVFRKGSMADVYATKICENISKLGYKNRGVKVGKDLYFLNTTKAEAILVECCFVDDGDDIRLYDANSMAHAIASAIDPDIDAKDGNSVEESTILVNGQGVPVRRILKDGTNYIAIRDIATALDYEITNQGSIAVLIKKEG